MKHAKSKFVWDADKMVLVEGKLPTRHQQLFKGEDLNGKKMEIVYDEKLDATCCYWDWS